MIWYDMIWYGMYVVLFAVHWCRAWWWCMGGYTLSVPVSVVHACMQSSSIRENALLRNRPSRFHLKCSMARTLLEPLLGLAVN